MNYYERYIGVTASDLNLPKLQRDRLIDPAIVGLHDFVDSYGYDGQTIGIAKSFPSYLRGGSAAVSGTALTYSDNAVQFDGGSSNRMVLPEPFLLPTDTLDGMVCVWMKAVPTGHAAGTTAEMVIGTHASGGTQSYNISLAADGSGVVNDLYQRFGTTTTVASSGNISNNIGGAKALAVCDGVWHQVVSRFLVSPDLATHKSLFYLDNALISESAWIGRDSGSLLKTNTESRLGVPTGGNRCFKGGIKRVWAASISLGTRTAEEIITQDWEYNRARLVV